ncbi:rifin [Plasmodium falciparum Dd2]|uniref:Rifin n=1 Tax=Plasmodium falciparum (isolate Dd2) TaxID=57267 RepID=A0A0L7LX62_PLAF4|nr:rifin [Plasmodium falciparum Dd2]
MKIHYINILLFELPLNILVYNQRNYYITPRHTETNRSLCECELYAPSNYDNDPEMKAVMQDFDRQTSQRFEEYNERLLENKQKCKEQCDKEIQKIILKDKLEKELTEKFATLQTDIQSDAIPTCICEKSLADKVEKGCLKCGGVLGGGIAPTFGLIGSVAINMWKTTEIAAVIAAAEKAGALAGEAVRIPAAIEAVISGIKSKFSIDTLGGEALKSFITAQKYNKVALISQSIHMEYSSCLPSVSVSGAGSPPLLVPGANKPICRTVGKLYLDQGNVLNQSLLPGYIQNDVEKIVTGAKTTADAAAKTTAERITEGAIKTNTAEVNATYASCQTVIIASVVAILVIVLVMIIIYLILRYRRKKKMKKKLQYIKLLKE